MAREYSRGMKHDPTFSAPIAPGGQRDVPGALTPRQARFVRAYVATLNATQAAITAGYSKRSACEQGNRLLTKDHIVQAVQELIFARAPLLQAHVLDETATLALANSADYFDWEMSEPVAEILDDGSTLIRERAAVRLKPSRELTRRQTAALKRITERTGADGSRRVEIELHNKDASLDRLAKLLGMLGNNETSINITAPVTSVTVSYVDDPQVIEGNAREVADNDDR